MLAKIVFLFSASIALSLHLGTTPEELQTIIAEIDTLIKEREHEAQIEIRDNLIPLEVFTQNAQSYIIGNLTEAAKPYWNEVAALQEQAEADGQDIASCIDLGNSQLYKLNDTTVLPLIQQITWYYNEGNKTLYNSSQAAYDTVEELIALKLRVNECSDDDCAGELRVEALAFYQRASNTIYDAMQVAYNYVQVDLEGHLDELIIDSDTYVESYAPYLEDIKNCIKNL